LVKLSLGFHPIFQNSGNQVFYLCLMASFMGLQKFLEATNMPEQLGQEAGQFNMFRVEDMNLPGHKPVTYSRRDFYKVSLVTGESNIHYADHTVHIPGSVIVFTNPMIPFYWERVAAQHSGFVCIFTGAFFNSAGNVKDFDVLQYAGAGVLPVEGTQLALFSGLFEKMYAELQGNYHGKYDLCRNILMEIVHNAQKIQPGPGQPVAAGTAAERITGLFAELLERQFPVELTNQVIRLKTPSDFARQLNVHVNHLNKALRETTGQTTSQLVNGRILQEARLLLKSTDWTVNEIAWALGFKEPNHFSTFFKTMAGTTPKQFRLAVD